MKKLNTYAVRFSNAHCAVTDEISALTAVGAIVRTMCKYVHFHVAPRHIDAVVRLAK